MLTGSFVSVFLGFTYLQCLVHGVHFDLFCLLFWVLVYILVNVTNFLRNEGVYIFNGEKTTPIVGKNKVCMQINAF